MSVPPTERLFMPIVPPALVTGVFGQVVSAAGIGGGPGYTLVSYLTAPLPDASRLDFVVLCHEDADDWRWTFKSPASMFIFKQTSGEPLANVEHGGVGQLETIVEVWNAGAVRARLSLIQDVVAPGPLFATVSAGLGAVGGDMLFALREICEDFKAYIEAAAASTGPTGIPARLLAAVLFMEAWARAKDGSPKARAVRAKLEGQSYNPRLQAVEEFLRRKAGTPVRRLHLHDIRDVELDLIRGFLNDMLTGTFADPSFLAAGRKSLGVGQIAMTTAAMTAAKFPWVDIREAHAAADLEAIDASFRALSAADFLEIFNLLRFPEANIMVAATLLAAIKNRAHRFPGMTARDVLTNPRAIGVIATEYNRGARDTPLATFVENGNGSRARKYVTAPSSIGLDRFFPDPP
jgi:hypothetical protein